MAAQANPGQVAGKLVAVGFVEQLTLGAWAAMCQIRTPVCLVELISIPAGLSACMREQVWPSGSGSMAPGMVKVGQLWNDCSMPGF